MGARTVVADVADTLARRVASGQYAPGDLMPSVRQVAEEFHLNRATAQLILGRLESYGFVDAHRGKGFTIRDVRAQGGVEVHRRLFRLSTDTPPLAAEMFANLVDEERGIVLEALQSYTEQCRTGGRRGHDPAAFGPAIDELEVLAGGDAPDYRRLLSAELALVRRLLTVLGHGMQRAVLNSLGEMVFEVPEAVESFYAVSPQRHVVFWRNLAAVWESGSGPTEVQRAEFEELFARYHARVTAHFGGLIGAVGEPVAAAAAVGA